MRHYPEFRTIPSKLTISDPKAFFSRFRVSLRLIIVVPMVVTMMTAVVAVAIVIAWIVGGAVINASVVVIPIPGIAVAAMVIAWPVISRCHTHAEAEVLSLRIRRKQSKQP